MRNVIIVIVLVAAAAGAWIFFKARGVQQAAVKWEGQVPEITSEDIKKDKDVVNVKLTSRIDDYLVGGTEATTRPDARGDIRGPKIEIS